MLSTRRDTKQRDQAKQANSCVQTRDLLAQRAITAYFTWACQRGHLHRRLRRLARPTVSVSQIADRRLLIDSGFLDREKRRWHRFTAPHGPKPEFPSAVWWQFTLQVDATDVAEERQLSVLTVRTLSFPSEKPHLIARATMPIMLRSSGSTNSRQGDANHICSLLDGIS